MPTPAVLAMPCLSCGTDYLTNPATRTSINDTTMPVGCECPGCDVLRAEIAASASPDAIPAEQGIDYLAPVMITARPRMTLNPWGANTSRVVTAGLCPTCLPTVVATMNDGARCDWCSVANDAVIDPCLRLADEDGTPLSTTQVQTGRRGGLLPNTNRRMHSTYVMTSFSMEGTTGSVSEPLCDTCYDSALECAECTRMISEGSSFSCNECEIDVCSSCWDGSHYRHDRDDYEDNSTDRGRYAFTPRQSIPGALATFSRSGATILSTRALGIEIETARGTAAPVIAAEREAAFPVIAAVGTDGSVRGRNAVEYRLLPLRGAVAEFGLRSMATWCREAGYAPDSSAGVHMHVDARDLTIAQVWHAFASLVMLEGVLFSHADPARLSSTYCQGFGTEAVPVVQRALAAATRNPTYFDYNEVGANSRYRSINCHSYGQHNTLEVRVFDSTHSDAEVERFTDAAAIIAGAVDFAASPEFAEFLTGADVADRPMTAMRLLGSMASNGHITLDTFARAAARMDMRMAVAA